MIYSFSNNTATPKHLGGVPFFRNHFMEEKLYSTWNSNSQTFH